MIQTVLIAGGTGLIGQRLAQYLHAAGYEVRILSRRGDVAPSIPVYEWDLTKDWVDPAALDLVDVVINLAGAGIADSRWSESRKQVLYRSRVDSNHLLVRHLRKQGLSPKLFIGASAIGIYGDRGDEILTESAKLGRPSDFLVQLSRAWEESHHLFAEVSARVVSVRIGLVLSNDGGALPTLNKSVVFGLGATLGTGNQYMSWIHMDDLIRVFHHVMVHCSIGGVVNGVAPEPVNNRQFIRSIMDIKGRSGLILRVPAWILKLALGEMAHVLLDGARVVPRKMHQSGFDFIYGTLDAALQHLLKQR